VIHESGVLPQRDRDRPAAVVQVGVEDGRAEAVLYIFAGAAAGTASAA
jgi:hypothetical protein